MPKSPGARVLALVFAALVAMTVAAVALAMVLRLGDSRSPAADPGPAAAAAGDHQPARPSGPARASPLALS